MLKLRHKLVAVALTLLTVCGLTTHEVSPPSRLETITPVVETKPQIKREATTIEPKHDFYNEIIEEVEDLVSSGDLQNFHLKYRRTSSKNKKRNES